MRSMGKELADLLQCSWHRALAQDVLRTRNGRSGGKLTKSDYEWKGYFSSVELLRKPLTSWQFLHLAAPGLSGKRRALQQRHIPSLAFRHVSGRKAVLGGCGNIRQTPCRFIKLQ